MSLRTRLILTFLFLILITMTIIAVSLAVILRDYQRDVQLARLGDAAVPLAFQARALFLNNVSPREVVARLQPQTEGVGGILIFTDKGLVLADGANNLTNRTLNLAQFARPNAPRGFIYGARQLQNQRLLFAAIASGQVNGQSVYVGLAARERPFFQILDELGASILLAGTITLIVALLVAVLLARSIARPITQLTQATEAIAKGQYDHRVETKSGGEIGRLATSFNSMAAQVQQARQMEKDFVANVSHELKTPLTSIQGFAQAILDGAVVDITGAKRAAQTIFDETMRMTHLVGDLLTLARLESGQIPLARDTVDLAELLPRWVERCRPHAIASGGSIVTVIDAVPAIVGDANRLEQVVTNLIENAIKYNRPGGAVTVTAKGEPLENAGRSTLLARRKITPQLAPQWIRIEVADAGEGIPKEDLPRVFERFYRGDKARVAGGTGLGLSIAQEIVNAHGGTITIKSELGRGSTFTIHLPVQNGNRPPTADNRPS